MASSAAPVQLALAESAEAPGQAAPWIGPLLALGSRAARYSRKGGDRQLVVVVSVPRRDYAAALIGCGWVLASEPPTLSEPLEVLRSMKPGQSIRAVNSQHVVAGAFTSLNEAVWPPQAQFAGSKWRVDGIRAIAPLVETETPKRSPRPEPGGIEHMARLDLTWDARLALPAADLAIVGTVTWLVEDFEASLSVEKAGWPPSVVRSILMPKSPRVATWFTRVYASARLADNLPIPPDVSAVVLDGHSAMRYLIEIEARVVICVLDRSVADETGAEIVMQLRNTRGEPLSLTQSLEWWPPAGVEALGFTVAL